MLQFTSPSYTVNEGINEVQVCVRIRESAPGEGIIALGVHVPFVMATVITNMSTADGEMNRICYCITRFKHSSSYLRK